MRVVNLMLAVSTLAASLAVAATESSRLDRISLPEATSMLPQAGAVDPQVYRLGPGDILVLFVWGPITLTERIEVGPDGEVFVPGMGAVAVAGGTLAEAQRKIEQLVRSQYRGVRVDIRLQRIRQFFAYLTGEVKQPGPVLAQGSSRVADVLPDSMFLPEASHRNIVVRRVDGTEIVVDLGLFQRRGLNGGDEWLRDGDVVYVPRATSFVGVWGGVARPDRYELSPRDSLMTLLRIGGGVLPAALPEAMFVRWKTPTERESLWVPIGDAERGAYNPPLRDGDQLYVFFNPDYHAVHQVTVVGHVQRAGEYPIRLGFSRFSDAIESAGGFREGADLSAIRLIRTRPQRVGDDVEFDRLSKLPREAMTESEYEAFRTQLAARSPDFRVEWGRVQRGDPALDPLLMDGDIIRVERLTNTVRVDGQVRRPGVFEYQSGKPWSHYVQLAGGWTDRAARTKVRVTRAVNGQTVLARNAEGITPGDFIWVPERPDVTTWEQVKDLLTVAAQVATIWIAIQR